MDFDQIKNILDKTGLSCDDLLKQLQLYKSKGINETKTEENVVSSSQESTSSKETNDFPSKDDKELKEVEEFPEPSTSTEENSAPETTSEEKQENNTENGVENVEEKSKDGDLSIESSLINKDKEEDPTINTNDENNHESESNQVDSTDNESTDNIEDLRNIIKLQLNSLRNRKKVLLVNPTNLENEVEIIENKKKKITENVPLKLDEQLDDSIKNNIENGEPSNVQDSHKPESPKNEDVEKETKISNDKNSTLPIKNTDNSNEEPLKETLYSQTNEFDGLFIVNVEGGVEFEESEEPKPSTSSETTHMNGAIDSLRKIIHKEKKSTTNSSHPPPREQGKPARELQQIPVVYEPKSISDKSPFLSNSLDEFLTGNSELQISYEVPKLGAEDGLKKRDWREPSPERFPQATTSSESKQSKPKQFPDIKAKTLAEKRKLLETTTKQSYKQLVTPSTSEIEKKSVETPPVEHVQLKPAEKSSENLVDHKRKITRLSTGAIVEKRKIPKPPVEKKAKTESLLTSSNKNYVELNAPLKSSRVSYVKLDGKKIWLRKAYKPGLKCVLKSTQTVTTTPEKLSLLNTLYNRNKNNIKYKAGPLSRKTIQGNDWETIVKKLPTINYEVVPEFGKAIAFRHLLPVSDGELRANDVEFALTAIKSVEKPKTFRFPLKYANNQDKIVVRIKSLDRTDCAPSKARSVEEEVENVVDKLLNYVETKELTQGVVKEEKIENQDEESLKCEENNKAVSSKIKRKRNRVDLELSRLSCKIVNVISNPEEEEWKEDADKPCTKSFCKLGCVCKSLACENVGADHCKLTECMFECTCPRTEQMVYYGNNLNIRLNEDALSTDAVNRIDFQVKRNLAKVEKEFTQTIIQANNKTIVVGGKPRRATKAPKRYSDYVDNFDKHERSTSMISNTSTTSIASSSSENSTELECFVPLAKLSLSDAVPFCLRHHQHNCVCWATKTLVRKVGLKEPRKILLKPAKEVSKEVKPVVKEKLTKFEARPKVLVPEKNIEGASGEEFRNIKPCARVLGVPYNIRDRNKHSTYLQRLMRKDNSLEGSIYNVVYGKAHLKDSAIIYVDSDDVDASDSKLKKQELDNKLGRKRKQSFDNILEDHFPLAKKNVKEFSTDFSVQRRKKLTISTSSDPSPSSVVVGSLFEGETIIESHETELLATLGPKTWQGHARLLPWTNLLKLFTERQIGIWCLEDKPSRLLVNLSDKMPPKKYIDIMKSRVESELMQWIKARRLPDKYSDRSLSFILKPTKNHYEICGICTKNKTDGVEEVGGKRKVVEKVEKYENLVSIFRHKNVDNEVQKLHLVRQVFEKTKLTQEIENIGLHDSVLLEPLEVALPTFKNIDYKWRLINLEKYRNRYLKFILSGYTLSVNVLKEVQGMAQRNKETFILQGNFPFPDQEVKIYFGVYCTPCQRTFVGPFLRSGNKDFLDLSTTTGFTLNLEDSIWLVSEPGHSSTNVTVKPAIAAPVEDQEHLSSNEKQFLTMLKSFTKINLLERNVILNSDEYNRYITTNIPHFGYIGAKQHLNSSTFDVAWPFERKTLRFQNVTMAKDFLYNRLSILLLRIPESFKIDVKILTRIEPEMRLKPVEIEYLNGHFICGSFGIHNGKNVSEVFCKHVLHMRKSELMEKFSKRAQCFITYHVTKFGKLLDLIQDEKKMFSIPYILNSANDEIKKLKENIEKSQQNKRALIKDKQKYLNKLKLLIDKLPPNEQKVQKKIRDDIVKEQPVIVLKDSDEDAEDSDDDVQITFESKPPKKASPEASKFNSKFLNIFHTRSPNLRINYKSILKSPPQAPPEKVTLPNFTTVTLTPPARLMTRHIPAPPIITERRATPTPVRMANIPMTRKLVKTTQQIPAAKPCDNSSLPSSSSCVKKSLSPRRKDVETNVGTLVLLKYPDNDKKGKIISINK